VSLTGGTIIARSIIASSITNGGASLPTGFKQLAYNPTTGAFAYYG
jgi:hypothetical protein